MDKELKASGIGSEEGVVMIFDNENKIYELDDKDLQALQKFLNLGHNQGFIWVKTIADFHVTITWIGKHFNCVLEVGQLTPLEILPLMDSIQVFMFPNIGPPSTKHMEDIKSVISDSNTWKLDNRIAFYNVWENNIPKEHLTIEGHEGTWYVIDTTVTLRHGKIYLLEHEQYGDETASLIIDNELNVLVEDVCNGFDDYNEKYMD